MNTRGLHWSLAVTCVVVSILCSIGASIAAGAMWWVMFISSGAFAFVAGINVALATRRSRNG